MKPHDRHPPVDEAQWQAQEKARRGDADADPAEARIARALRHAPPVQLPADFAAQVAALAHAQAARPPVAANDSLERNLLRGLVLVLALAAAVVVAWYGRGWIAELAAVLPGGGDAVGWSGMAALCLLGNWSIGALRQRSDGGFPAAT